MRSQPSRMPLAEEGLTRLHRPKGISLRDIAQAISLVLALMMLRAIALAQEPDQSSQQPQPAPIERAHELKSKVTFAVYYVPNEVTYDINFRRQFDSVVAWMGG